MGAGRAWGWAWGLVGAVGARAVLGALCAFLPCIPLLLCQEGPAASGIPLFGHHLSILAHLSSKMPFVGCQGETQVGGLTAEQSPSQTVCLGAKNPDFFSPPRHHDMLVLTRPQGCVTEEVMGPWPAVSPCFPQGKTCPGGARLQPHIRIGTKVFSGSQILPSCCDAIRKAEAGTTRTCCCGGVEWGGMGAVGGRQPEEEE